MKKLPITKVKVGNVLAEDVIASNKVMIVPKGTIVTESILELLSNNSVFMVTVEEETEASIEKDDSYFNTLKKSKEFVQFKEKYNHSIENFKDTLNEIVTRNAKLDPKLLINQALNIYQSDSGSFGIMDFMMNMREYDDSTFCHSMNVALIGRVFGEWLHWNEEEKNLVMLCGLLHDIGKLKIPEEIVKKPGRLSDEEYEIIKQHPLLGYKILENRNLDVRVKNATLMHHEKCDGSGYPFHLQAHQLDRYTKLITIADIYDAMTANRVYRGPMSPFEVVNSFEKDGLQKFDPELIMTFLQNVANSFLNNKVTLSNGHEGKVIFINKTHLSRPTVLCGDEFVDLASNPNITIEKMV